MIAELSPGLILIVGGLLVPLLPARLRPLLVGGAAGRSHSPIS